MGGETKSVAGPSEFPLSRVKTIMHSAPGIKEVSSESVFLVSKAAELFIKSMAEGAYDQGGKPRTLEYKHISNLVQSRENLGFLKDIVPKKRKMKDIAEEVNQRSIEMESLMSETFPSSDDEMTPPASVPSSSEGRSSRMKNNLK